MSPQEISPWVTIAKDVLLALAALTGSVVAIRGLRTWRRQLRGQSEYELARRFLRAALKVRDTIKLVRHPFISTAEMAAALKQAQIPEEQRKSDRQIYQRAAYAARWDKLSSALSDLRVEALEGEVLWGEDARRVLDPLYDAVGHLHASLHRFLDNLDRPELDPPADLHDRLRAVIYETTTDLTEDVFGARVQDAIKNIENFLKPKLRLM